LTRNWRALVAYDGTRYQGFQVQASGSTVQGELERALAQVTGGPVRVAGAGRTDAGVHASGQVISFRLASALDGTVLGRGVNALLPEDIAVSEVEPGSTWRFTRERVGTPPRVRKFHSKAIRSSGSYPTIGWRPSSPSRQP